MTDLNRGEDTERGATTAQLKADINSGRTGDKVGGIDPAASPLGTDDEAAGTPPTAEVVADARAQETAGPSSGGAKANAATPSLAPDAKLGGQRGLPLALIAGVLAALLVAYLLFTAL